MDAKWKIEKLSKTAPDWRAALLILTSDFFLNDSRVWSHVDLDRESIAFSKMLDDGSFSGGERRLLEVAASLFSQKHMLNLWVTFGYLDEQAAALAIRAIDTFSFFVSERERPPWELPKSEV